MNPSAIFQIDHPLVSEEYKKSNYEIILDESVPKGTCALYFCSHDIYFPNEKAAFQKKIIERNSYEWFNRRLKNVHKHIFLRDIHKQWYLTGINSSIDSPEKLFQFLFYETESCTVTTLGSSAGGYAAILYGSLLKADKIFSFNGQTELNSLLKSTSNRLNPILFKFQNTDLKKYYDIKLFLNTDSNIFYFYSINSVWDKQQALHVSDSKINCIGFKTTHHGIPFLKCSLSSVLNLSKLKLISLSNKKFNPILFSIKISGVYPVTIFLLKISINKIYFFLKKLKINKITSSLN
jgi:hypothetical protein